MRPRLKNRPSRRRRRGGAGRGKPGSRACRDSGRDRSQPDPSELGAITPQRGRGTGGQGGRAHRPARPRAMQGAETPCSEPGWPRHGQSNPDGMYTNENRRANRGGGKRRDDRGRGGGGKATRGFATTSPATTRRCYGVKATLGGAARMVDSGQCETSVSTSGARWT